MRSVLIDSAKLTAALLLGFAVLIGAASWLGPTIDDPAFPKRVRAAVDRLNPL